jgi:hypothetical protein
MFHRVVEALAAVLLVMSLVALYHCLASLGDQDYVAAVLLAAVGLGSMRSGVELARSSLGR